MNFGAVKARKSVYKPLLELEKASVPLEKRNIDSDQLNVKSYDFPVNLDDKEKFYIDLFSLRILSLLVCRGEVKEKAEFLLDLIQIRHLNNEVETHDDDDTKRKDNEKIDFANERLIRALKLIVYFSVVLPGTFMSYYQNDDVFQKIIFHREDKFNKNR